MADAGRNSTGAADRQERQQRDRQAVQPGAAGGGETEGAGPQEAREEAQHTHGKTRKHSSGEI